MPITWKNVGQTRQDLGGYEAAGRLLESGTDALGKAAQTYIDRGAKAKEQRTSDAIYGLQNIKSLADLETARGVDETSLGDIDINKYRAALSARQPAIVAERDFAEQEARRGFDSGIALEQGGTLAGQQAQLVNLRGQIDALDMPRSEKDKLYKERKGMIGFTPQRTRQLAMQGATVTDPATGATTIATNKLTAILKAEGESATDIEAFITAERKLSGEYQREQKATAIAEEQRTFDLGVARQQYGVANTNNRLLDMKDFDNRSNATEAVTLARTQGYPEHVINQATRTATEEEWWGEEAKLGTGNFIKEMNKLMDSGWQPKGAQPTSSTKKASSKETPEKKTPAAKAESNLRGSVLVGRNPLITNRNAPIGPRTASIPSGSGTGLPTNLNTQEFLRNLQQAR